MRVSSPEPHHSAEFGCPDETLRPISSPEKRYSPVLLI